MSSLSVCLSVCLSLCRSLSLSLSNTLSGWIITCVCQNILLFFSNTYHSTLDSYLISFTLLLKYKNSLTYQLSLLTSNTYWLIHSHTHSISHCSVLTQTFNHVLILLIHSNTHLQNHFLTHYALLTLPFLNLLI